MLRGHNRGPFSRYSGATAAVLPAGSLGVWYADAYVSSPRPTIPNSATATATSGNLFGAPRRMFSNNEWWNGTGCTITDSAATAPDGSSDASTSVGVGNWFIASRSPGQIPAGTYTIAMNAKRNTGSDQTFAFTSDNTGTHSATKTATSAWQRFSYTFALVGATSIGVIFPCSIDGATNANLQICDLELYAGSSDLGPQTLAGHLYPGMSSVDTRPSCASGVLDLTTAAALGLIQFGTATSYTTMTAMAVVSKTATNTSYEGLLSNVHNYTNFTHYADLSNAPQGVLGAAIVAANSLANHGGLFDPYNQGWHILSVRYDGTNVDLFIDDVLILRNAGTPSATSIIDFFVNAVNTKDLTGPLKYNSLALWASALSDANLRTAVTALKNRAALSSLTFSGARILIPEGDSITSDTGADPVTYAYRFGANANPLVFGGVYALGGSTLATMAARGATVDLAIPPATAGRKFILSFLIGANDLRTYAGATDAIAAASYLAALATYADARRAAGFKVVACTILPYYSAGDPTGTAHHNVRRAIVNTAITTTWTGVHCDAVADFAGNATMGPDAAAQNATYYSDGQHPTNAGHIILEPIYRSAVNGL